jgi:hypothetical protein
MIEYCNAEGITSLDGILFSGDAAYSGHADEYKLFADRVVTPLTSAFTIPPSRFIAVPGNHDCNRPSIRKIMTPGLRAAATDPDKSDELWHNGPDRTLALERQEAFQQFAADSGVQIRSVTLPEGIGIACINSAWISTDDEDRHQLLITRAQIDEEYDRISDQLVKIALFHHPLDWLSDTDAARVRDRLLTRFDMCCFGHMHEESGLTTTSPFGGQTYLFQAPALFSSDRNPTGFLIYEIALPERRLSAVSFRWDARRGTYSPNTDFAPEGKWAAELPTRHPSTLNLLSARAQSGGIEAAKALARLNRHLPAISGRGNALSAEERFLRPNIISTQGAPISLAQLVQDKSSYLLVGVRRSGKTALSDYLAHQLNAANQLCISIAFTAIEDQTDIKQVISSALGLSRTKAGHLANLGVVLLIDNVVCDPAHRGWEAIRSWTSAGKARVIAFGRPPLTGVRVEEWGESWKVGELKPLSVAAVRSEFQRIEKSAGLSATPSIRAAVHILLDAELPRWPWVVAIMSELSNHSISGDVENLSALLRLYIDLRNGALDSLAGERPRIRERMLHLLAAQMMSTNCDVLSKDSATELVGAELRSSGIKLDPTLILDELCQMQLLDYNDAGSISFGFVVLQEFFFAEYRREHAWTSVGDLTGDDLIRQGGSLVFLSEMVRVKGLVAKCLSLAEANAPESRPFRLEELADISALMSRSSADDTVSGVRASAPAPSAVESQISEAEAGGRGRRARRIKQGGQGLHGLATFGEQFRVAVEVLRAELWLPKADKLSGVRRAVRLAERLVALIIHDEELMTRIVKGRHSEASSKVFAFVGTIVFVIVGSLVAELGGAPHLGSTIEEALTAEESEVGRLLLFMWYVAIGGEDLIAIATRQVKAAESIVFVQVLEVWMYTRFVTDVAWSEENIAETERVLRVVVEERIRRTSEMGVGPMKNEASRVIETARKERRLRRTRFKEGLKD